MAYQQTIFTARIPEAMYVLHVFQKKTQATSKFDNGIAKESYN
jgi:phage-related protein